MIPVEALGDLEGVLVKFVTEVSVEFEIERGQLHNELFEKHQIVNALVHDLVDLELEEPSVLAVLALENDGVFLTHELVVDLDLTQLE